MISKRNKRFEQTQITKFNKSFEQTQKKFSLRWRKKRRHMLEKKWYLIDVLHTCILLVYYRHTFQKPIFGMTI